jgi:hypothetical protein
MNLVVYFIIVIAVLTLFSLIYCNIKPVDIDEEEANTEL